MPSALDLLLSRLRRDMENAEAPLRSQLVLIYESAIAELEHDLFNVTWLIEDALSRGETISPDWLYRQDRYQRLIVKAEAQMQRFAGEAMPVMERTFQSGARLGAGHATPLLEAAGIQASFGTSINTVATDRLYQMMFTQGSPLRDLLEGYGPHVGSVIRHHLGQAVILGKSPREAVRSITQALASGENRARLTTLTRTEMMRSYRLSQQEQLEPYAHAIKAYRWSAALQSRTCLACLAMDGQEFDEPQHKMHPNCFPAGTLVNGPAVEAATKRWYVGELVEITTAEGERLSVTPNHPILTTRGWVAAGKLREGDYVINYRRPEGPFAAINPDYENNHARIEDVSESLLHELGDVVRSVPTTAKDFHGDGSDGEVDIVLVDRLLGRRGYTAFFEPLGNEQLAGIGVNESALFGSGALDELRSTSLDASNSVMGSTSECSTFLRGGLGHAGVHSLRPASDGNSGLFEVTANDEPLRSVFGGERLLGHSPYIKASDLIHRKNNLGSSIGEPGRSNDLTNSSGAAPDLASNLHNALPRGVLLDNVVSVNRRGFAGHVYNLQTSEGWYIANNIISHNCRCICTPIGYYTPERYKRQSGADWFAQQPEAVQRGMFPSQASYEAYKRGELPLSAFVGEKHSDVWGTSIYERSGKEAMVRAKR